MADLLDRLNADLKQALKARDELRLGVVRMLLARIKEKQVEPGVERPLDDRQIEQIVATYAKQRRESAEAFEKAGRTDLCDKEMREREVVLAYLPEQLDDDAVRAVLREVISETHVSSMRDLGKVMGPAMQRLRGRVEGGRVQQLARELLGG